MKYGETDLQLLTGGMAVDFLDGLFEEYLKEARPMAQKIVDDIEQQE